MLTVPHPDTPCADPWRQQGQLFMMGFDGTSVTPQIRKLIQEHHLGSILLTAKNLKCMPWTLCVIEMPEQVYAYVFQPPKKLQSCAMSCRIVLMMPATLFRCSSASTKRMEVSTVCSMRFISASTPVPWGWLPQDPLN